jgi:hypothetical protein
MVPAFQDHLADVASLVKQQILTEAQTDTVPESAATEASSRTS